MKKMLCRAPAVAILAICSFAMFAGCKDEEPMEWWEDRYNITYVLEDERAEPASYTFTKKEQPSEIQFIYVDTENVAKQYLPSIKVIYGGEEKDFYFTMILSLFIRKKTNIIQI